VHQRDTNDLAVAKVDITTARAGGKAVAARVEGNLVSHVAARAQGRNGGLQDVSAVVEHSDVRALPRARCGGLEQRRCLEADNSRRHEARQIGLPAV
jgi:hypothetical protein